jgi:hypothetical protein
VGCLPRLSRRTVGVRERRFPLAKVRPVPARFLAIAYGLPCENCLLVYCQDTNDSSGGEGWWGPWPYGSGDRVQWAFSDEHPYPYGLCIDSGISNSDRRFYGFYRDLGENADIDADALNTFPGMRISGECDGDHCLIQQAAAAARSARFEHGESGAKR